MGRPRNQLTYRLSQLPGYLTAADVASFLASASDKFGPESSIHVFSLATSLLPWERTKVATLLFKTTPKEFDNDKGKWVVSLRDIHDGLELILDVLFDGFTPLNDVDQSTHLAEYVFRRHMLQTGALVLILILKLHCHTRT